jgi:hypothetical protein
MNMRPSSAKRIEFPMLPSGNAAKNSEATAPGFSFPMVPAF